MSGANDNTPDAGGTASDASSASSGGESPPQTAASAQQGIVMLAVIAAIVAGVVVGVVLFGVPGDSPGTAEPDGTVAVVDISGPIFGPIGEDLENELRDIRANDSIDAVVLKMDTPGGAPAAAERMYMSIQRTSEQMPVLASVQEMSASAGYYMMLPAEEIYALPTSQVGSVGLAAGAPQAAPPTRGPSGPDKRGSNVIHQWAQLEALGDIFIDTVMEKRGDRIELDREGVATADIFLGVRSVENGYADEIGTIDDAVADAAERAGLEEYQIAEREVGGESFFPIVAETEHGYVAIHDEDPSLGEVQPLEYAWVHEPAIPHIDEIEAVASPDIEEKIEKIAEEDEEGGDQP